MVLSKSKIFGSSPRMWGILFRRCGMGVFPRFIPTHVGNTVMMLAFYGCQAVHPHACGEYKVNTDAPPDTHGSSPRMWGILLFPFQYGRNLRFIPTHVGNTSLLPPVSGWASVHPHACGEYLLSSKNLYPACGSSPRMWGIHKDKKYQERLSRFIPTHVGNTSCI